MPEPLMSIDGLAEWLNVPAESIRKWRAKGEGPPAYRLGKHLRFRPAEVEQWLSANRDLVEEGRR